jgi:hypothetical protein
MNQKVKQQRVLNYLWLLHIPKELRKGRLLKGPSIWAPDTQVNPNPHCWVAKSSTFRKA